MTGKTFDELYSSKPDYKRFDQRNTAFGQAIEKTGNVVEFGAEEYRSKKIKDKNAGFGLVEYAFNGAAGLYEYPEGTTDTQGMGYYSWSSLGQVTKPKDIPKWEGRPEEAAQIIKRVAKYFGACGVGFTRLDKRWFYSRSRYGKPLVFDDEIDEGYITEEKAVFPTKHQYVIAVAIPMEYDEFMHAPTQLEVTTNMGYSRMHHMAGQLAEFIRGLGWHATPVGNDTAISVPIAIQAGLGHAGRFGRLITWEHGPLVRLMKIYTDLPLPQSELAHPKTHINVVFSTIANCHMVSFPATNNVFIPSAASIPRWLVVTSGSRAAFGIKRVGRSRLRLWLRRAVSVRCYGVKYRPSDLAWQRIVVHWGRVCWQANGRTGDRLAG